MFASVELILHLAFINMVVYITGRVKLSGCFLYLGYCAVMNGQTAGKDGGHEGSPFFSKSGN